MCRLLTMILEFLKSKTDTLRLTQMNDMYNHAPSEYVCPFCLLVQSKESTETQLKQTDIVFQTADVTAFMATRKYPHNQGHVLIIPNEHFENIYDLPQEISAKVH